MSNFIRGGQITLHKLRMLSQVIKVLTRVSSVILMVSVIYTFNTSLNSKDWVIGLTFIKKEIMLSLNSNASINFISKNGELRTIKAKNFGTDPYVRQVKKKFEKVFNQITYLVIVLAIIILGSIFLFFFFKGRAIKKTHNLRGIFLIKSRQLKKSINKNNQHIAKYKPFKIANFYFPIAGRSNSWSAGEQSHTLILGSTGSGKTRIIQQLIYQLHQRNQKAIIVDVKGDYIKNFYRQKRGDIILNPLDIRGSNWSIFNETNPLKGFSTIAKSLLPNSSKSEPIWTEAARNVLSELANLYVSAGLSMNQFADKILKVDLKVLANLLEKSSASKIINSNLEKAALSVLMVLSTYLRPLKLYRQTDNCFSISEWVKDESQQNFLFISSRADVKEDINPLISTQVDIAINALRALKDESNKPKIWFVLDELAYFDQPMPSLKDGLATVRSYGGCFVLGTQDMSSLAKIYSDKTAEAIANNCKTKIFMNLEGKESAEWGSQSIGEGEIEEWHESLSYGANDMRDGVSVNKTRTIKRAVLSSELMMLKAGEGYIKFAGYEPAKFRFADSNFHKIADGFMENNELLEIFKLELEDSEKRRIEIEKKLVSSNNFENDDESINTDNLKKGSEITENIQSYIETL